MKVFRVKTGFDDSQCHCVVAKSISDVERLWKTEYDTDIKSIELVSDYVIVQGHEDNRKLATRYEQEREASRRTEAK